MVAEPRADSDTEIPAECQGQRQHERRTRNPGTNSGEARSNSVGRRAARAHLAPRCIQGLQHGTRQRRPRTCLRALHPRQDHQCHGGHELGAALPASGHGPQAQPS